MGRNLLNLKNLCPHDFAGKLIFLNLDSARRELNPVRFLKKFSESTKFVFLLHIHLRKQSARSFLKICDVNGKGGGIVKN